MASVTLDLLLPMLSGAMGHGHPSRYSLELTELVRAGGEHEEGSGVGKVDRQHHQIEEEVVVMAQDADSRAITTCSHTMVFLRVSQYRCHSTGLSLG